MSDGFQHLIPNLPPAADIFNSHQLAYEFRREVQTREDFAAYCRWYHETANQHEQEFKNMRNDLNILGWFL